MELGRLVDAYNRVVNQLNNGYLDISDDLGYDDDEMEIVRNAIDEYRINHLDGITITLVEK